MSERFLEFVDATFDRLKEASDSAVLAELAALPPLVDGTHESWSEDGYWEQVAARYVALADVASVRRLRAAIPLLLDRACFGDPGEIMRGLRHQLEAIVNPDWSVLADYCLAAASSERLGTRLWAIDELRILEDARAAPVFEAAILLCPDDIKWRAEQGLERLKRHHQQ